MNNSYSTWSHMKKRCDDPKVCNYKWYGGKGIKYQKSWSKFDNFIKDMGERPKGTSLDRMDSSKGYSKKNCRWIDAKLQNRNKIRTIYVTYRGETKTLPEWSEILNVSYNTLYSRTALLKWPMDRAVNQKVKKQKTN